MNKLDLTALLERVRNATGPDQGLDEAIALALCDEHYFAQLADAPPNTGCEMYRIGQHSFSSALRVTGSIDAALALVERVLPKLCPGVSQSVFNLSWHAWLGDQREGEAVVVAEASHDISGALAILTALLLALTSNQEGNDEA